MLNKITNSGVWCGFCAIPSRILCDKSDCKLCFDKSFASHPRSNYWSKKNVKQPRDVFKSSPSKYLFDCEKCCHEIDISLDNITQKDAWCCYCANQKLCDKEDCKTCLEKSFASHPKHLFWSSKNIKKPREVFKSTPSKYLFVCELEHNFESRLNNISSCGSWCPSCKKKTEAKLFEKMIQFYPSIITQFKQEWCKNIKYLLFDFCIPEPKIIIELDGIQHFKPVPFWKSTPEENFENDRYKEKCANENGYSTIRILQEDVWNDKYDWCKELCEAIENIKNENKSGNNIYLCKNGEYDKFI